ncbi:MAG: class I SAM-dependent methyltransferase [Lentisphaerae bacterium]|nr:class I SAM-dependent methyltransferase [Lentisphaerota bacterium]
MDFDALAAQWDDNPIRRGLTEALAKAMSKALPQTGMSTALEIGCGTGTLALTLAGRFERILATDASLGMVEQLNRKLAETPVDGTIEPMHIDLLTTPPPPGRYDLVYSAMALHHVEDAGRLVSVMAELVRRGGVAIVADLSPEDGSFHAPETVPHNGIAEAQLREWFGVRSDNSFLRDRPHDQQRRPGLPRFPGCGEQGSCADGGGLPRRPVCPGRCGRLARRPALMLLDRHAFVWLASDQRHQRRAASLATDWPQCKPVVDRSAGTPAGHVLHRGVLVAAAG